MNKAQCSTFTVAGASGLASLRECFHLPGSNKAGRNWETLSGEKHVCLCCAPTHPRIGDNLSWEVPRNSGSAGRDTKHCGCAQTCELLPCQGALSYTYRTDTSVDTKLHMAFTPLVTALALWKGLTVLRVLAEACRTLCCMGGCTLVSIDPRVAQLPSCHDPPGCSRDPL